jgi:two-component system response regulator HydG
MADTKNRTRVLIVDDEPGARAALRELLCEEGFDARGAADGFKALGLLDDWTPDVVISDLRMPGLDGLQLMQKLRDKVPGLPVVVVTAFGSVDGAVEALHEGADDYITKPIDLAQVLRVLERVASRRALSDTAQRVREEVEQPVTTGEPIDLRGRSSAVTELLRCAAHVASSRVPVLIQGEAGTGRAALARRLHDLSPQTAGPFVTMRGSASADDAQAELFGDASHVGALARARGGSLFLDGVDGLPLPIQRRLAATLRRDPSTSPDDDVRVIASTALDLAREATSGRFDPELLQVLDVVKLRVPTLRERRDDIPVLASNFLRVFTRKHARSVFGIGTRALAMLSGFDWPGNVRQLEKAIEHAVVMCGGSEIEPRDLPRELWSGHRPADEMPAIPGATLQEVERYLILKTLEHVGGSTSKAAKTLGISPRKIQYRLAEYRQH